jgi:hypothetical protein
METDYPTNTNTVLYLENGRGQILIEFESQKLYLLQTIEEAAYLEATTVKDLEVPKADILIKNLHTEEVDINYHLHLM